MSARDRKLLELQLAEAGLAAGKPVDAQRRFRQLQDWAEQQDDPLANDARLVFGLAESLLALQRYSEALPLYNRVYRQVEANTSLWWRALLGDLRCRTETGEDPAGIIKAIKQHGYLYHNEMGGPRLEAEFQTLLDQNVRRAGS